MNHNCCLWLLWMLLKGPLFICCYFTCFLLYWSIQLNVIDLLKYIDGHGKTRGKNLEKWQIASKSVRSGSTSCHIEVKCWHLREIAFQVLIPPPTLFSFTHEMQKIHCHDGSLILFYLRVFFFFLIFSLNRFSPIWLTWPENKQDILIIRLTFLSSPFSASSISSPVHCWWFNRCTAFHQKVLEDV